MPRRWRNVVRHMLLPYPKYQSASVAIPTVQRSKHQTSSQRKRRAPVRGAVDNPARGQYVGPPGTADRRRHRGSEEDAEEEAKDRPAAREDEAQGASEAGA